MRDSEFSAAPPQLFPEVREGYEGDRGSFEGWGSPYALI